LFVRDDLGKKERELKEHEDKMFDMCGSQDFEEGIYGLQDKLKKLQE
jgi:hypothetical protein